MTCHEAVHAAKLRASASARRMATLPVDLATLCNSFLSKHARQPQTDARRLLAEQPSFQTPAVAMILRCHCSPVWSNKSLRAHRPQAAEVDLSYLDPRSC